MWVKISQGNGQEAVGRPFRLLLGAAGSLYLKEESFREFLGSLVVRSQCFYGSGHDSAPG